MPTTLLLPDLRQKLADLSRRLGILERRVRPETVGTQDSELIFSLPGALTVSTSPKAYVRVDSRLVHVISSLGTAGSSTTTVLIKKNGSTIATISLVSSDTFDRTRVTDTFLADTDALTVAVSAAGTGAADLTVQARFS